MHFLILSFGFHFINIFNDPMFNLKNNKHFNNVSEDKKSLKNSTNSTNSANSTNSSIEMKSVHLIQF